MAKKLKQKSTITSLEEAMETMGRLKSIVIEIETTKQAADESVLRIQTAFNERMRPLQEQQLEHETNLRLFAEENKTELFDAQNRKTIQTPFGTFGFRQMPASIVVRMKRIADVITAMKAGGKRFTVYIRTKEELDKPAVKAAYDNGMLSDRDLSAVGLGIEAKEEFVYGIDRQEAGQPA